MAEDNPGPTRNRLSRGLVDLAGQVPGYVLSRAAGLGPLQAGLQSLSSLLTEKIIGPTAALTGIFVGILKTVTAIVRQTELMAKGIERAGQVERIESAFTTLLRSASRAREEMKKLVDFSLRSPFGFEGVAEASRTLQVLTKGAYAGSAALKQVSDVAAATNSNIEDTAFWIGKLYNFLQNDRPIANLLFRLQDVGIVSGELANTLETLEAQGAGFAQKWGAVQKELLRAKGATEEEAKSLFGLRQQVANAGEALERAFGTPFVTQEKAGIEATLRLYHAFTPAIAAIAQQTAEVTNLWREMTNAVKTGAARFEETTGFVEGLTRVFGGLAKALAVVGGVRVAGLLTRGVRTFATTGGARAVAASRFASGSLTNAEAIRQQQEFARQSARASAAGARAASSLREGALFAAGAIATEAGAAKLSAVALSAKARAAEVSAISGKRAGLAAIFLGDALKGMARLATRLGGGFLRSIFAIGPIGAALTAATLIFEKIRGQQEAALATARANEQLAQALFDTTRAMREQISAIATLADYSTALARATGNVRSAEEALANFRARDKGSGDRKTREILEQGLATARLQREAVIRRRAEGSLLETPEQAAQRAAERREQRDIRFQGAFEQADEAGRLRLLRQRQAELEAEAREGELLRSQPAPAEAARFDRFDAQIEDLQQRRAQLDKLAQDIANPDTQRDARAGVEASLRSAALSESEQAELQDLTRRRVATAQELRIGPDIPARQQIQIARDLQIGAQSQEQFEQLREAERVFRRFEELQQRLAGVRSPNRAQVDAEIERRLAERTQIEGEIARVTAERSQLERESVNPLIRLNRELADLAQQIERTPVAERGSLQGRQTQIQREIADLQLKRERAGAAGLEAGEIGSVRIPLQEIAARDESTRQRLTEIGLKAERDILNTRLRGVVAEGQRLAIEEQAAEAELQVLRDRLAAATTNQERREIGNQIAEGENRLRSVQRQQQEAEASRQEFLRGQRENLAVSELFARGDRKGAQRLADQFEIQNRARELVDQGGLAPDQALAAAQRSFAAEEMARAIQQGPRVIADSLQSIGGGGRAVALDPALKTTERIAALAAEGNNLMKQLLDFVRAQEPRPDEKGSH